MEGQLIDVYVEVQSFDTDHEPEHVIMLAKVVKEYDYKIEIRYLSETTKRYEEQVVYNFDEEITIITKETITGYYDSTNPECAGYILIDNIGYVREEDLDDDYSPSEDEQN